MGTVVELYGHGMMTPRSRVAVAGLLGLLLGAAAVGLQSHPAASPLDAGAAVEQDELNPNLASSTGACGVERWSVKTGTDPDAHLVNGDSTAYTTIATMRSYSKPSTLPPNNRIQPQETTVYSIDATLTKYKLEADSDYHLVIQDGSGLTMITEIPDPACAARSQFLAGIQNARSEFDAKFNATGTFKTTSTPVRVRGIGFFDFLHGQTGVAPNGIELHAVLDIQFNPPPLGPTVTSVSPNSGSTAGGTSVTITGTNFSAVRAVTFGTSAARSYFVIDPTQIVAISPSGTGTVDLTVTTPFGRSAATGSDQFTYLVPPPSISSLMPRQGPVAGGTQVKVHGANFINVVSVMFGSSAAAGFTVSDSTQIIATSPPGGGIVDVRVTTATGTSPPAPTDRFRYGRAVAQSTPTSPPDRGAKQSPLKTPTPTHRAPSAQAGPSAVASSPTSSNSKASSAGLRAPLLMASLLDLLSAWVNDAIETWSLELASFRRLVI